MFVYDAYERCCHGKGKDPSVDREMAPVFSSFGPGNLHLERSGSGCDSRNSQVGRQTCSKIISLNYVLY